MQGRFLTATASIWRCAAPARRYEFSAVWADRQLSRYRIAAGRGRFEGYKRRRTLSSLSFGLPSRSSLRVRRKVERSASTEATARQSSLSTYASSVDWSLGDSNP